MKSIENQSPYKSWVIHLSGSILALCMPLTLSVWSDFSWIFYLRSFITTLGFLAIFYLNYCLLIDRFLTTSKLARFFLWNFVSITMVIMVVHSLLHLLPLLSDDFAYGQSHPRLRGDGIRFFLGKSMIYVLVVGLSVAVKVTVGWYRVLALKRELENSRAEAELQNLKSQLSPHFLFNTLNNVYSLIAISPERAQETVHELSLLLRYVLYDSNLPRVELRSELQFIRNYVELMRIRLPHHVKLDVTIKEENPETMIAPLIFISPIENAFKHGVSDHDSSFIAIAITQKGNSIECQIRNSYFPKLAGQDKSGSGIGLVNLRKRLDLLYGTRYELSTAIEEGKIYHFQLKIDLP